MEIVMRLNYVLSVLLCAIVTGCKKDNETVAPAPVTPVVSVAVSNLPQLVTNEGHYQVWASFTIFSKQGGVNSPLHDSGFVSLGEFTIGPDGHSLVDPDSGGPAHFSIPSGQNVQLLNNVIIAIQTPEAGLAKVLHEEPGSTLIGARFVGTQSLAVADLNVAYQDAFGTDFASVTGKYTLTAPTSVPADSNSGVWFYQPLPTPAASLQHLANLKGHWTYEGWVLDKSDTTYYSTGKFARADSADYDGTGPGSGGGVGLSFPGQDFITGNGGTLPRPNLSSSRYAIRISIEPNPDNSPNPFFLTLLSSDIPGPNRIQNATGLTLDMQNVISSRLPTAHITVAR
jgi:hypothetical protein